MKRCSEIAITLMRLILAPLFLTSRKALAIPVDNGVIGEPEIECGSDAIFVAFNTQNYFDGHVYVKGHYEFDYCRTDATNGLVASIRVPFAKCGTIRQRSLNPPGIYLSTVVIITFHPAFITKVDRAYQIRCYYMEATKTVAQQLDVSMLTTAIVTETIAMPICRYEVLRGGPYGEPVRYAIVGEPVFHKWTCDTETIDVFCMRVHSCYVEDGHGASVEILDYNGCSNDRYLLQDLDYINDLTAGKESHVFKYADRPSVYFQCQISLYLKEESYCKRVACNDYGSAPLPNHHQGGGPLQPPHRIGGSGPPPYKEKSAAAAAVAAAAGKRSKRHSAQKSRAHSPDVPVRNGTEYLVDVVADAFNVLDLNDTFSALPDAAFGRVVGGGGGGVHTNSAPGSTVCLSYAVFIMITVIIFVILLTIMSFILALVFFKRRRDVKKATEAYLRG